MPDEMIKKKASSSMVKPSPKPEEKYVDNKVEGGDESQFNTTVDDMCSNATAEQCQYMVDCAGKRMKELNGGSEEEVTDEMDTEGMPE